MSARLAARLAPRDYELEAYSLCGFVQAAAPYKRRIDAALVSFAADAFAAIGALSHCGEKSHCGAMSHCEGLASDIAALQQQTALQQAALLRRQAFRQALN